MPAATATGATGAVRLNERCFLKPGVKLEPLICGWYAWSYMIPPAQHALNLANRHIPLLQSFAKNASAHVAAQLDPAMFGGPFVDLPATRVNEVEQLLQRTMAHCATRLRLARDLKEIDRLLQDNANGYSMSEFYARIPDSLQGLIEFVYDLNSHPRLRIQEELIYDEYQNEENEAILLSLIPDERRPFFMSTPRLPSAQDLLLQVPFSNPVVDTLASLRTRPAPLAELVRELGIRDDERAVFESFLTTTIPERQDAAYLGNAVRVRYFGHACVLVQTAQVSILIDPMLAWDDGHSDGRYIFNNLPDHLDYVVLSHNHQDHCAPEMLLQLRHRVGQIVVPRNNAGSLADPSMKLALRHLGFKRIHQLGAFEEIPIPDGMITSLPFPGEHVDLDIHSRHGIHLNLKGRRLAFLVDSDGRDPHLFRRIARKMDRRLDALFIGMECHGAPLSWLYGPLLTAAISRRNDESRRLSGLDSQRAWNVIQEFHASNVFVYAMGQEPWLRYIMGLEYTPESIQLREVASLLQRCELQGIKAQHLLIRAEFEF